MSRRVRARRAERGSGRGSGRVVAAMALTVMLVVGAGFGAAAVPPDWRSGGDGARSAAASRSTPADPDLEAADDPVFRRGSPQRPLGAVDDPLTLLVLLLSLAGLAFALSRNERLVSADDHRPDAGSELDRVGGLATAPQVEDLKPAAAVALVDEALGLLRADLEPRLAVRCAYAAVASGLGRAELARRPSETEGEFLERHLARFDRTAAEPLERLTTTFERARFSADAITEDDREGALADLSALRQAIVGAAVVLPVGREPR